MVTGTAPPRPTVSEAVERGGQALYAAAMPRGATPWERHSHAFQGIYLERSCTVLAAGLDVEEMARSWHEAGNGPGSWERASEHIRERSRMRASTVRDNLLGGAG